MNLLYIGDVTGTSRHRSEALRRAGWNVEVIDPRACFGNSRLAEMWIWRGGSLGMEDVVRRYVLARLKRPQYDFCIVNHGELVGPALVRDLKGRCAAVLHFNLDNPFC